MSAEPQAHPQSAEWARIIYSGIETGSLGPHTIDSGAVYISTHDSRMIANSTINVEKFEVNNYGGDARGGHSERQQIVKWLVDTDDNIKQQTSIFSKAWQSREGEPESGSWLLANQEFQAWLAGNIQALWLHGGVGCGKTVLSTLVVRNLQIVCGNGPGPRVFFYLCSFRYAAGQEFSFMLRMILAQIMLSSLTTPEVVLELYNECRRSNPWQEYGTEINPPSLDQLKRAVLSTLVERRQALEKSLSELTSDREQPPNKVLSRIFLIIDGLDEILIRQHRSTLEYLQRVVDLGFVQLLITSRTQPNIERVLVTKLSWPAVTINKAAVRQDIELFVSNTIERSSLQELPVDLQDDVKETLVQRGESMFLWVSLQLRHLQDLGIGHAETIRYELRTLPEDLHETYTRIVNRIVPRLRTKAVRALRWLALTRRPLSMNELAEACGIQDELSKVPDLRELNSLEPCHIDEILSDLLYVDPPLLGEPSSSCTVTLAHASVQDFLVGNDAIEQAGDPKLPFLAIHHSGGVPEADSFLGECCLAYVFSFNQPGASKESHPFLQYAWYHWEEHLQPESLSLEITNQTYFRLRAVHMLKDMPADFRRHLGWLPQFSEERLLDALDIPYFYPGFNAFKLGAKVDDTLEPHEWTGQAGMDIEKRRAFRLLGWKAYEPLRDPKVEVRLLDILPRLSSSKPIACRLIAVPIQDAPTFDAISYLWGSSDTAQTICVNGVCMVVRENLGQVLGNLRHRSESEDAQLWVDAISIDQSNAAERRHQVILQATIFSSARRVLISLGSAEGGDNEGIDNVIAAAKLVRTASSARRHELREFILNPRNRILQLFEKTYWSRVWIVQEIALAKDLTMLIGPFSLSLKHLEACLSVLGPNQDEEESYTEPLTRADTRGLKNVLEILRTRQEFRSQGGCDFLEILLRFKHHSASDFKDKIYGLLGLLGRHGLDIPVDYNMSVQETYLAATKAVLQHDQNLRVLSYNPVRRMANNSSPTWCMYPASELEAPVISLLGDGSKGSILYCAGGTAIKDELRLNGTVLPLNGIVVAEIANKLRFPVARAIDDWRFIINQLLKIHHAQTQVSSNGTNQNASAIDVRWRTLLADQFPRGRRLASTRYKGFLVPPTTLSEEADLWSVLNADVVFEYLQGRDLFTAESNGDEILMLGPSTAEPGDIAAILIGGAVPFVLRAVGNANEFLLVGECYIHGLMDGEALQSERYPPQIFNLI